MLNNIDIFRRRRFIRTGLLVLLVLAFIGIILFFVNNYYSKEDYSINFVSGTEYISDEAGQVIVRVSDSLGRPIDQMNCTATILYPNKTYFMYQGEMIPSSVSGNYYKSFVTPYTVGVYEETVFCNKLGGRDYIISSSFHVSLALNIVQQIALNQMQQYGELTNKLNKTLSDVNDLAVQLNEARIDIDYKINSTVEGRFNKFYNDTATAYKNFGEIFTR